MNTKVKQILSKFSYVIFSNFITLLTSFVAVMVLPKVIGVTEYGYWQLYIFYVAYVGFTHLGWVDGLYLKLGGRSFSGLKKEEFSDQVQLLAIFSTLLMVLGIVLSLFFVDEANKKIIYIMFCVNILVVNVRTAIVYVMQATNMLKESSRILILDRAIYIVTILALLLFGVRDYRQLILADILAKVISLVYSFVISKNMTYRLVRITRSGLLEAYDNVRVGINLMFSNIASSFIIGVIRIGIKNTWGIESFSKISLTLNISNLMMIFINAIGVVIFPILKKMDDKRLNIIYISLRRLLVFTILFVMILYYPLKLVLDFWLPNYHESFVYLALVFPISVFEGRMSLLINPYFKALRMEKTIKFINFFVLAVSVILTGVNYLLFKNMTMYIMSIIILLGLRAGVSEWILGKRLRLDLRRDMAMELMVILVFILSSWWMSSPINLFIYIAAYAGYVIINLKNIKETLATVKAFSTSK